MSDVVVSTSDGVSLGAAVSDSVTSNRIVFSEGMYQCYLTAESGDCTKQITYTFAAEGDLPVEIYWGVRYSEVLPWRLCDSAGQPAGCVETPPDDPAVSVEILPVE